MNKIKSVFLLGFLCVGSQVMFASEEQASYSRTGEQVAYNTGNPQKKLEQLDFDGYRLTKERMKRLFEKYGEEGAKGVFNNLRKVPENSTYFSDIRNILGEADALINEFAQEKRETSLKQIDANPAPEQEGGEAAPNAQDIEEDGTVIAEKQALEDKVARLETEVRSLKAKTYEEFKEQFAGQIKKDYYTAADYKAVTGNYATAYRDNGELQKKLGEIWDEYDKSYKANLVNELLFEELLKQVNGEENELFKDKNFKEPAVMKGIRKEALAKAERKIEKETAAAEKAAAEKAEAEKKNAADV